jgi:hypothetical protein
MAIAVEGRVISDVAVISAGETVDGRFDITADTLADVLRLMTAKADGTKVLADHDAEVEDLVGRLVNPRMSQDGLSVRADLEVFESAEAGDIILESAAKMPGEFGLSINATEAEVIEGVLRVRKLTSVDLAGDPAANRNGLLSVDSGAPIKANPAAPSTYDITDMTPDEIKALVAECMASYAEELKSIKASLEAMVPPAAPSPEEEEAEMAALSAKVADKVTAQLRASLGLGEGVKLAVSPEGTAPKSPEGTPSAQLTVILRKHVADGKTRTEACTLAAKADPALYQAAMKDGGIRF